MTSGADSFQYSVPQSTTSGLSSIRVLRSDYSLSDFLSLSFSLACAEKTAPEPAEQKGNIVIGILDGLSGTMGGTVGEFVNGEKWQQAEYKYQYSPRYRPEAKIWNKNGEYYMVIDDEDDMPFTRPVDIYTHYGLFVGSTFVFSAWMPILL